LFKQKFKPFEFVVKEVYIISRSGFEDPFDVRYVVPLGGSASEPHFTPIPLPAEPRGVLSNTRVLITVHSFLSRPKNEKRKRERNENENRTRKETMTR